MWALCAAVWADVAGACPFMEYSGSGTQNRPFANTQKNKNIYNSCLMSPDGI